MPEAKFTLQIGNGVAADFDGARNKWYPTERGLAPEASAEPRAAFVQIARCGELSADRLHRIRMQAEISGTSGAELDQVESGRPTDWQTSRASAFSRSLNLAAIVPDLIACNGVPTQMLPRRCVLDTIFDRQHHVAELNWSEAEMQDYRTGRHCVFELLVHLVFVTKYRRDVLSELAIRDLAAIFASVCEDFGAALVECNGEDDHVHLLGTYPPQVSVSKLVNSLKGVSSRLIRDQRPEIRGRYYKGVLWSPSYFAASCGGATISILKQFVEQQREAAPPPRPERRGFRRGKR